MREWTERENQSYAEFQIQRGCRIGEKTIESDGADGRGTAYTILAYAYTSFYRFIYYSLSSVSRRVLASQCEPLRSDNLFNTREKNRTPFASGY